MIHFSPSPRSRTAVWCVTTCIGLYSFGSSIKSAGNATTAWRCKFASALSDDNVLPLWLALPQAPSPHINLSQPSPPPRCTAQNCNVRLLYVPRTPGGRPASPPLFNTVRFLVAIHLPASHVLTCCRTLTFLSTSRPTILGFQAATNNVLPDINAVVVDVVPRISESPVLRALQIRCGPRDTFNPSHRVRKRRHGFLSRLKTRKGRATLKRRQLKGRRFLSH
jgi:large subunit ribosomal protein L34